MCMFGLQKSDQKLTCLIVAMAMQCLHLNHVTDFLRGIAEKWVRFTCVTESRIVNFNVTTSSDVSLQMCFSTMSDLWWFDSMLLSLGCFPTGISDGQQIKECIMNSDK